MLKQFSKKNHFFFFKRKNFIIGKFWGFLIMEIYIICIAQKYALSKQSRVAKIR